MTSPSRLPPEGGLILLLGALVAFGPLAIDLYLPALPAMAAGLQASAEAVQLSITVFLAGFSLGMLFYGPLSDRFGRRPVLLAGIALFAAASLACLVAGSVGQLIGARFIQALGGGAASVLARAVVRDLYTPNEAIRRLSLMAMVTAVAPLLAPLLGSVLLVYCGWRGPFAALLLWGGVSLVVVWRQLPETLPSARRGQMSMAAAFGAYRTLLADPLALGWLLAGGMSFAAMFVYITGGPFYFIERQGFSPLAFSLLFAANALGIFAANYLNSRLVRRFGAMRMAGAGSVLGFVGALWLWFAMVGESLSGVIAGLFVVVSVTGLLGANCVGLLMARYERNAGAAAALFGAAQFGLGMLASGTLSYLRDRDGRTMAAVILVLGGLSLAGWWLSRQRLRAEAGA